MSIFPLGSSCCGADPIKPAAAAAVDPAAAGGDDGKEPGIDPVILEHCDRSVMNSLRDAISKVILKGTSLRIGCGLLHRLAQRISRGSLGVTSLQRLGRTAFLFAFLPVLAGSSQALAQGNPWGSPTPQPLPSSPWGGGGGSPATGPGPQATGPLSFPSQGVICDSSVSVCFNASGAALLETEQEFGRRARRNLERNLINNPIIDVTFADGRYCNFSQRGCWINRQRTQLDPRLNPWLFGAAAGAGGPGGQGTVIGGTGSSWGPGSGINPGVPPAGSYRPPFTRTRQSGSCVWTNAGITIYDGTCGYEIVQNNVAGSKTLVFRFDRLPASNPLRTLQFTAQGNNPWSLLLPNGSTATVQSRINAEAYRTDIQLAWGNVFNLGFRSSTQATTTQLNQALQPVGANGQVLQGNESEALGQALGGLLQQLFGGR